MDKPALVATAESLAVQPLRILIVLNVPWDERLGVVRVWAELGREWRILGHAVEHFSLSEAFPTGEASGAGLAVRQLLFAYKARAFVRQNAARFDIVDALIGSLPWRKARLGFRGLLVARSVGLYQLYHRFDKFAARRWPRRGRLAGRVFYSIIRLLNLIASRAAVLNADLVNVPNQTEALCINTEISPDARIIVQPYGLSEQSRRRFSLATAPPQVRIRNKKVCFVGMWSPRKGSHDWGQIIRLVRAEVPDVRFVFMGTMISPEQILKDVDLPSASWLELRSDYRADELPALLSDCTVGAFPSYVEGFGIAVLEQLAAGVPTIAYDVAGPRDILGGELPELLVPPGDVRKFSDILVRLLQSDVSRYETLSSRSMNIAAGFDWAAIASEAASALRLHLRKAVGAVDDQ